MYSVPLNNKILPAESMVTTDNVRNNEVFSECVNSIIHGLGILYGLAAIPLLIAMATRFNTGSVTIATVVYGFSFLMLFTFSTMYHGFQHPLIKKILEVFDHISIYFFIAGTYTPIIVRYMFNSTGITMLVLLWSLVLAGTLFKIFFGCKYNIVSTIVYILMGWMLVWTSDEFFRMMPANVKILIVTGGILYSIGVVFYLWQKLKWHHAIWHLFVVGAAVCHYFAIYNAVLKPIV